MSSWNFMTFVIFSGFISNMIGFKYFQTTYTRSLSILYIYRSISLGLTLTKRKINSSNLRERSEFKTYIYCKGKIKSEFNDPDIYQQWYFIRSKVDRLNPSHQLNKIWSKGITGKGVKVAIVGGGVEVEHDDLKNNHDINLSFNFIHNNKIINYSHKGHATRSIGLVSAVANNKLCGVGAAPGSKFSNLQIFDDQHNFYDDSILAKAIRYQNNLIDIYLINWTLNYTNEQLQMPGPYTITALEEDFKYGRGGLGNIVVSGSGEYRQKGNNCAFNGLLQRPEVLVFGSINSFGRLSTYLEKCTAVLAASLSNKYNLYIDPLYSTDTGNMCRNSTGGSHVSASISSGILALLLSYSKNLTFRQIMTSIILTSKQYDKIILINSAKFVYSYNYGFGLLDTEKLLTISKSNIIRNLAPEHICSTFIFYGNRKIDRRSNHVVYIYTSGCLNSSFCVTRAEQVYVIFTLETEIRGHIKMFLTSATGTEMRILERRMFDKSDKGFLNWRIKVMGFYGENIVGVWKIEISTNDHQAYLQRLELIFHGICVNMKVNIKTHMMVRNFILRNPLQMNSSKLIELYTANEITFDRNLINIDIYSFTGVQFPLLYRLNNILKRI